MLLSTQSSTTSPHQNKIIIKKLQKGLLIRHLILSWYTSTRWYIRYIGWSYCDSLIVAIDLEKMEGQYRMIEGHVQSRRLHLRFYLLDINIGYNFFPIDCIGLKVDDVLHDARFY